MDFSTGGQKGQCTNQMLRQEYNVYRPAMNGSVDADAVYPNHNSVLHFD
jgi:hypothetical protein